MSNCQGQRSNSLISSRFKTQYTLKAGKIIGSIVFVSVGLLGFCARSTLAGGHVSPVFVSQMMGGGALTVSNGTGRDAYVKLVEPNSRTLVAAFSVKSNSSFTQEQIPDGAYRVLFVLGNGWNPQTQSFTKNKSFAKFDKLLNFTTMQMMGGIQYRVFKITLHPVRSGKAKTSGVSQKEFDSY
jgi:hypothetical protein